MRLSQYIGDFQPDAQVKGLLGCNLIALICNKNSATFCSISFLLLIPQMYQIYINQTELIITETVNQSFLNSQHIDYDGFDFFSFYNRFRDVPHPSVYLLTAPDAKQLF